MNAELKRQKHPKNGHGSNVGMSYHSIAHSISFHFNQILLSITVTSRMTCVCTRIGSFAAEILRIDFILIDG